MVKAGLLGAVGVLTIAGMAAGAAEAQGPGARDAAAAAAAAAADADEWPLGQPRRRALVGRDERAGRLGGLSPAIPRLSPARILGGAALLRHRPEPLRPLCADQRLQLGTLLRR